MKGLLRRPTAIWLALLIGCLAVAVPLPASPDGGGGLLFPPNNGALGSKGQLVIPSAGTLNIDGPFSCSFDLSVWDPGTFGYVISVIDPSGFVARLTYFPRPLDSDSADIVLSVNHEPTDVSVSLATASLHRGRWFPLEFLVDPTGGFIRLRFAGKLAGEEQLTLPSRLAPAIVFGHTPSAVEAPPMAIRNLSVSVATNNGSGWRVAHQWPLDQQEGESSVDQIGSVEASQSNCQWLAGQARQWTLESRIPMEPLDPVVFDRSRSRVIVVGKLALTSLTLADGRTTRLPYVAPRPLRGDQVKAAYHDGMDRLLVYHNGTGEVSVYEDSSRTWSAIDTVTAHDQHYYTHAVFADQTGNGLYAMGGYGWFTAKNTVQRYSFAERAWTPLAIRGSDSVAPRYSAVVGEGDSAHLWYMFGGWGNGTGRQEASFHPLRDLWLLDLRARSWTKIFDTLDIDRDFIPQGVTRAAASGDLLMVGGFVREDTVAVQLLALTPRSGTVRHLTDVPRDIQMQPFPLVAFDRRRGCVVLGTIRAENPRLTALQIYTHKYPPAPDVEQPSFAGLREGEVKQLLLALGLTATLGFALWVYRKRHPSVDWGEYRADSDHRDVLLVEKPGPPPPEGVRPTVAADIRLFGGFRLLDSSRRDRSSEFSPKILELFLLIATHGHAEPTKNEGIPVQRVTSILWPHSTKESAKNSRGVALKSLRDLLGEIGGMTITRQADRLVLELDEGVTLDLFNVQRLMAALEASAPDPSTESLVAELLGILERGALVESAQYSWLAEVRESLGRKVSSALLKALPAFYTSTNVRLGLRLADRFLAVDPLNESALRVKLHALAAEGHHGEAAEVYSAFSTRYAEVFQRPFPRALRDILV